VARRRSRAVLVASLVASLVALALPDTAWGEEAHDGVQQRVFALERSPTALLATVSFADLFDARARQKLDSGFWNRVVVRINTLRANVDRPAALAARTCRVRREIWEDYYEVQVEDHTGRSSKRLSTAAEAVAQCTTLTRFPVASLASLRPGQHHIDVIAELNPMSQELLEKVRRWIRSPQGGHRQLGQGSNFFGSVVSIFINTKIGRSDRMLHIRSQAFAP
jgi:hypothetical protein